MKQKTLIMGIVLVLFLALPAFGAPILLNFEGLGNTEQVLNYYNGGYGGGGSGPGPSYGVTFGADSLAIISNTAGGSGNFTNSPSMPTIVFFLSGPGTVMNVPAGYDTGLSFYYAAYYAGSVDVYSDLDGGGTLLASLSLPTTPYPYTVWQPIGVGFTGTAKSAVFAGSADYIGFDNITLNSVTPVPVPPSAWLLVSSLVGLVGFRNKFTR